MLSLQASSLTVYKYTFIVALFVAEIMIFFRLAKKEQVSRPHFAVPGRTSCFGVGLSHKLL